MYFFSLIVLVVLTSVFIDFKRQSKLSEKKKFFFPFCVNYSINLSTKNNIVSFKKQSRYSVLRLAMRALLLF